MNKYIKTALFAILILTTISFNGFAQAAQLDDLRASANSFSRVMARSLPFNSTIGLNWSDAYIGKLIPSAPPHFGLGISMGFTTMSLEAISGLMDFFGGDISMPLGMNSMVLPAYTAEARIGGFFLPFDIGLKAGYMPNTNLPFYDFAVNYMLVGADVRYAIMEGNAVLPKISFGVGFNYLSGGISATGSNIIINHSGGSITINSPRIGLKWHAYTFDFTAQISKSFFIITPYIGLGATYSRSSAGFSIDATITTTGSTSGIDDFVITNSNMSAMHSYSGLFGYRVFGGFSINLAVFKIDLTGMYDIRERSYGTTIGFRFQL